MIKERYHRNILSKAIDRTEQRRLNNLRVFIAGIGGTGSGVIANLTCLGIENFGICDYDIVQENNLNRQFIHNELKIGLNKTASALQWLMSYNSRVKVKLFDQRLNFLNAKTLIKDYDIVIECLDNWDARFALNLACVELNKTFIHVGCEELKGEVLTVVPHKTACLDCYLDRTNIPLINRGVISPIVNIISSIASYEVIKFIKNKPIGDVIYSYDLATNDSKKLSLYLNTSCRTCSKI